MNRPAHAAAIGAAVSLCLALAATPALAQVTSQAWHGPESRAVRPNPRLLIPSIGILVAAYVPSAAIAATSDRAGDPWLYAPVIGPWGDLINREGCVDSGGNCDNEQLYKLLLVSSGVVQVAGLAGIIASFIVPEYEVKAATQAAKPEVTIVPLRVAKNGYGVGISGRF